MKNTSANPTRLKMVAALTLFSCLLIPFGQSATVITTFGNSAATDAEWTWNDTTSTLSGSLGVGYILYNTSPLNLNLSSEAASVDLITLRFTGLTTTNPGGDFDLSLIDAEGREARWIFSWGSFGTSSTTITGGFSSAQADFDLTSILDWNLGSNGSGDSFNATFTQLEAIPEPSSVSLLMLGAAGLVALRRLRKF